MYENMQPKLLCQLDRAILGVIIDENTGVNLLGNFTDRHFQRLFGVVSRQNDNNAFSVDHASIVRSACLSYLAESDH